MTRNPPPPMPSASVVTPHKVQARLLNRALGLAPPSNGGNCNTSEQQTVSQTQTATLKKPTRENQQPSSPSRTGSSSSSKARVFRCLSNTNNKNGMCHSPPASSSSSSSSIRAHQQAQQRSALKSMFQPPASSPNRHMKPRQQPQERIPASHSSIYLGCRLDRSTISSRPLRKANGTESECEGRKVHFQPCVLVVKIPSHRDYPTLTKKTLWGSIKEIKANAIRNTAEFIYDKCNWRKSTEENQFYRDTRNGSLIHPVHVHRYYAALEKMKQQKKHLEEKKQQQQEQQQSENQEQEQVPGQPSEEEREERSSRKRVRCCTPSPIRRSHQEEEEQHQAKRARRTMIRVPHPVYYSQAPSYHVGCSRCQQENNYSYESYCRCYQQQPPMVHRSSYHPSSHYYHHRSYPATTEIA